MLYIYIHTTLYNLLQPYAKVSMTAHRRSRWSNRRPRDCPCHYPGGPVAGHQWWKMDH